MSDPRALADEIALREASLADAAREHAAGELDDTRYRAIVAREALALAELRGRASALADAPAPAARARLHRRRWLVVALLALVAAAGIVLAASLSPRQPGASVTGGVSLSGAARVTQLLSEAEADVAAGDEASALSAYGQVLAIAPDNVTALTQTGWLEFSAGSTAKDATLVTLGERLLERAAQRAPSDPAPRLYLGIAAYATPRNTAAARADFRAFLRLNPSAAQRALAAPYLLGLGLS